MHLHLLFIFVLVPIVLADDDWEDFTNNLATDLAPLITLFGTRLTKQFLSESVDLVDNVIFALSPLGVLTTVVSVIRVCGGSSLRAFIGRAQEGPADAESELLPCVSESTAELFNDRGISRVFGRPKVLEIVAWENDTVKDGERSVEFGTLLDAVRKGAWSKKGKGLSTEDWCRFPEVGIPNLSLNKGIKRRDQRWFYCAAILGSILQTGVVVYAALTVFIFPDTFKNNGKAVSSYAFPFFIIGTTFLFVGMFFSAVIIERSSKQYYLEPNKPSNLYWLQPGDQEVGDQVFGAFLAVKEAPDFYIKSVRDRRFDGQNVKIYLTIFFTILGFIFQFIGLRGLHASVILASLGATLVMSVLRTCLRTERMGPDENKLKEDRELTAHKQQELDFFAFYLEEVESFDMITPFSGDLSPDDASLEQTDDSDKALAKHLIQTRIRLAELTSRSDDGSTVAWDDMPIRTVAHNLARTIEATMDLISSWGIDFGKSFDFPLAFECQSASPKYRTPSQITYPISISRCGDALRWRVNPHELEAILGLWTWSLYKSDKEWRTPLSRLVGLDEAEAEKVEMYLYFHKWIFRQTEAKMASLKTMDSSRRLFGFESDVFAYERDLLVVTTENDLQTMAAQDVYTRFIQSAFSQLTKLGGEVDVSVGLHGAYVAQNSRINEFVHCFESCSLGSREDALLCIIPALKYNRLLPALAAECTSIRKRTERFILENEWAEAFRLVEWICKRSVGVELEYSVYELGHLCRLALLSNDKLAQREGFKHTCRLLESDPRTDFLRAQRMPLPSNWSQSLNIQQWWQLFSKQLGWVAWHISINVPGMDWMQPELRRINIQQDLSLPPGTSLDAEETRIGVRAMQEWLTFNHIDFEREYTDTEDSLGYSWALQGGFNALIYFLLVRLVELGAECPTLIQYAFALSAKCRSDRGIQVLQRRHADIDTLNDNKASALMEVVVLGDLGAVKTLLANGANPNGNERVLDKRPLIIAAMMGYTNIVKLLILEYGAILDVTDSFGLSALYWAVSENHLDTARFLLSHGADVNRGVDGSTPLHSAITGAIADNQMEMVHLVLEHGADVNAAGENLNLPLMRAAISSNAALLRLLLDKGADVYARDEEGLTALDWARRSDCEETAAILEVAMGHSFSRQCK
ncbi:uncharacterized protein N7498_007045 [Penicillium cinerascens]|uniref:Uncharacterized protein n=1 Tax=Penicillium cinerascens TaxID=70096 RepID=A0A9W9JJA0_9EURO|nr:uncharacterized protein N7498_007045 [Penicillium cinerascens]KAJ5197928.1 hypothetical protein N7498_007045 [Penicillium cinerascens]